MRSLLLLPILALAARAGAAERESVSLVESVPERSRQMVVVTSPDWDSFSARMQRYERTEKGWRAVGASVPAQVGERGLAWGRGLHRAPGAAKVKRKREGDRCAPAGVFYLPLVFGDGAERAGGRMPFRLLTADTEAVDDPKSRFYNQMVQRSEIGAPDWKSSERMAAIPDYALGLVVGHNADRVPGEGSCIFIHRWAEGRRGSAGCTLLRAGDLKTLVGWLQPDAQPVLVQGVEGETVIRR